MFGCGCKELTWSENCTKVCYTLLNCELGHVMNVFAEGIGREQMLLLGLSRERSRRVIATVKEFLERIWHAEGRQ